MPSFYDICRYSIKYFKLKCMIFSGKSNDHFLPPFLDNICDKSGRFYYWIENQCSLGLKCTNKQSPVISIFVQRKDYSSLCRKKWNLTVLQQISENDKLKKKFKWLKDVYVFVYASLRKTQFEILKLLRIMSSFCLLIFKQASNS